MATMRSRRRGRGAAKEEKATVEDRLNRHHPMRLNGDTVSATGHIRPMPHELPEEEFAEWLILNGMSESGYQESVKLGDAFLEDIKKNGRPIKTDHLTPDQRGWAKADYPEHYNNEMARWKPIPGKSSKVEPYKVKLTVHDRLYREHCDCPPSGMVDDDTMEDGVRLVPPPKMEFWGTRWDNIPLYQCQNCGEVVLSKTRAELAVTTSDDNNQENNDDDDE